MKMARAGGIETTGCAEIVALEETERHSKSSARETAAARDLGNR